MWLVDSTPVECGRPRDTASGPSSSALPAMAPVRATLATSGGLRLHLVGTPGGLPVAYALASPKADEREVVRDLLEIEPAW